MYILIFCMSYLFLMCDSLHQSPTLMTSCHRQDVIELEQWNELLETSPSAEETNCQKCCELNHQHHF